VTGELINAIATLPGVCHYIDIPLQHVSDSVLRRMGRRQTRADIERTLEKLRTAVPDIAIRTTMMTGFPGETDRDFDELMDFVSEQRFDRLGVFAYSDEDGTRAAQMPDKVPREVAEERRDAIMRRQLDISLENNRRHIGKVLDVLAESREEDAWVGRTEYDAPEIDGAVIFTAPTGGGARDVSADDIIGTFVKVRITDAMDYDLVGEMI
jgi:ribosomal protein S12 methylthiotransferase